SCRRSGWKSGSLAAAVDPDGVSVVLRAAPQAFAVCAPLRRFFPVGTLYEPGAVHGGRPAGAVRRRPSAVPGPRRFRLGRTAGGLRPPRPRSPRDGGALARPCPGRGGFSLGLFSAVPDDAASGQRMRDPVRPLLPGRVSGLFPDRRGAESLRLELLVPGAG